MNTNAFYHFYNYHFAENHNLWDVTIRSLSDVQSSRAAAYSQRSVRDQILHLISVDDIWFSVLSGVGPCVPLSLDIVDCQAAQ